MSLKYKFAFSSKSILIAKNRRSKICIILLLYLFLAVGCQNDNFVVLKPMNDTIGVKRIVLNRHKNPKGYVENYYIELEDYSIVKKHFITDLEIIIKDSAYTAQGIEIFWSREKITKDFFFAYSNDTKLIWLDTVDNSLMINILQKYSKNDRLHWVERELVID